MNVILPEKEKIKKSQLIIYISVILVCIICVVVAFYVQFYARIDLGSFIGMGAESQYGNKTDEEIVTLDGQKRKLDENMLVIADSKKPVAIGLCGGYTELGILYRGRVR